MSLITDPAYQLLQQTVSQVVPDNSQECDKKIVPQVTAVPVITKTGVTGVAGSWQEGGERQHEALQLQQGGGPDLGQ